MTTITGNRVSLYNEQNQACSSLTDDQNAQLFQMLGPKRVTLSTGVAQLFSTEPPAHSAWVKRHTGVLCFVKDHSRKSYYMQMYCLNREEMLWEHEMYEPFIMNNPRPFMLTFEGRDRIVSFNFVADEEAAGYLQAVRTVMSNRMRKKEERSRRTARPVNQGVMTSNRTNEDDSVILRKPKHNITTKPIHEISTKPMMTKIKTRNTNKKDKKVVKKFTKADIGTPTGFQHVTHVGWDSYKGFNFKGDDEEVLKPFLEKAGVSDKLLKNRETKAFILDFIQENKVVESIKAESKTVPTVPVRQSLKLSQPNHQKPSRMAPPPPSTKAPIYTNPVPKPPRINMPGPPKTAPPSNPTGAPPPPPPPPPTMMPPAPPPIEAHQPQHGKPARPDQSDPHSALLDSIRQGTTLKKVSERSDAGGEAPDRNDLLAEIRQGAKLRSVEERVISDQAVAGVEDEPSASDALALALKRALEQRKDAIHTDSDDGESDESFDNDDEWEA